MIPFGIFLGVCSGGVVFMLYFLVGFWGDGKAPSRKRTSVVHIPGPMSDVSTTRRIPALSRSGAEVLTDEALHERQAARAWQVFVNQEQPRMRRAR